MSTLPGIVTQRWAAACESPSLTQWISIAYWLKDFADIAARHQETAHLSGQLNELAQEARRNVRELMPEIEEAA